jgi:hypothetical protein
MQESLEYETEAFQRCCEVPELIIHPLHGWRNDDLFMKESDSVLDQLLLLEEDVELNF